MKKLKALELISNEVVNLTGSPLYKERIENNVYPVIGEGNCDARIIFVGEAPGRNEAKTGKPFCGAAGKILNELFASVEISRGDVYITNIVKDRPPFNRDPLPEEIEMYGPFLDREIDIIQPVVVATLGRYSMEYVMRRFQLEHELEPIGKAHGKTYEAQASYGTITIIPLYHPAVAVYNSKTKSTLIEDFKILKPYYLQ